MSSSHSSFAVDEPRIRQLLAASDACPRPELVERPRQALNPVAQPFPVEGHHLWHPVAYLLGLFAGVGLVIAACGFLAHSLFWFGFPIALVFDIWTLWFLITSPVGREWYARFARRRAARRASLALKAERRSLARGLESRDEGLRAEVHNAAHGCRELASEYAETLDDMTADAKRQAFEQHLLRRRIPVGEIPNIAEGRVRQLANHGVQCAADVSHYNVMSVPGFNEILTFALLEWRRKVEREFRFDPTRALDPARISQVSSGFHRRQAELLAGAGEAVRGLHALRAEAATTSQNLTHRETTAFAALQQAEADYRETDTLGPAKFGTIVATSGFAVSFVVVSLTWVSIAVSRAIPARESFAQGSVPTTRTQPVPVTERPAPKAVAKRPPENRPAPTPVPRESVSLPPSQPVVLPADTDDRAAGFARGDDGWPSAGQGTKPAPPEGAVSGVKAAPPVTYSVKPRAGRPAVLASGPEVIARYERLVANKETKVADDLVASKFVFLVDEPTEVSIHSKSPAGLYVRVQSGPLTGRVFAVDPWFMSPPP